MLLGKTDEAAVERLLELAIEDGQRSDVTWEELEKETGIGYSRGWLIVIRQILEQSYPQLLVSVDEVYKEADAQYVRAKRAFDRLQKEKAEEDPDFHIAEFMDPGTFREAFLAEVVRHARDREHDPFTKKDGQSWGLIAVRLDLPESRVRKLYRFGGYAKDKGSRIGRGGRWAYDDPTLYTEHRRREGAMIPVDLRGRPAPDDLLNAGDHHKAEVLAEIDQGLTPKPNGHKPTKAAAKRPAKRPAKKATTEKV